MSHSEQYQHIDPGNDDLNTVASSSFETLNFTEPFAEQQLLVPMEFRDLNGNNGNSEGVEKKAYKVQSHFINPLSHACSHQQLSIPQNCHSKEFPYQSFANGKTFQQSLEIPVDSITTSERHQKRSFQSPCHAITCQTKLEQMMYCDSAEKKCFNDSCSTAEHKEKAVINSKITVTGSGRKERNVSQLHRELRHHPYSVTSTFQVQQKEGPNSCGNICAATMSSPQVPSLNFQSGDASHNSKPMLDPCKIKVQTLQEKKKLSVKKSRLKTKELDMLHNFKRNYFIPIMDEYQRKMDVSLLWMKEFYEQRQSMSCTTTNAQNITFERLKKEMKVYRSMGAGNKRFLFFLKWAIDPDANSTLNQLRQKMLSEFKTNFSETSKEESSKEIFERLFESEKKRF